MAIFSSFLFFLRFSYAFSHTYIIILSISTVFSSSFTSCAMVKSYVYSSFFKTDLWSFLQFLYLKFPRIILPPGSDRNTEFSRFSLVYSFYYKYSLSCCHGFWSSLSFLVMHCPFFSSTQVGHTFLPFSFRVVFLLLSNCPHVCFVTATLYHSVEQLSFFFH